ARVIASGGRNRRVDAGGAAGRAARGTTGRCFCAGDSRAGHTERLAIAVDAAGGGAAEEVPAKAGAARIAVIGTLIVIVEWTAVIAGQGRGARQDRRRRRRDQRGILDINRSRVLVDNRCPVVIVRPRQARRQDDTGVALRVWRHLVGAKRGV